MVLMIVPVRVFMTVSAVIMVIFLWKLFLLVKYRCTDPAGRRLRGHRDFERLREWQQSIPLLSDATA
jgi:hypothetical protein